MASGGMGHLSRALLLAGVLAITMPQHALAARLSPSSAMGWSSRGLLDVGEQGEGNDASKANNSSRPCIESLSSRLDCDMQYMVIGDTTRQLDNTIALLPRLDFTNSFSQYKGGFNVTDDHYWTSLAWTGSYGFALGMIFLVGGIFYFLVRLVYLCCGQGFWPGKIYQKKLRDRTCCEKASNVFKWAVISGLVLLSVLGTATLFIGGGYFMSKLRDVIEVLDDSTAQLVANTSAISQAATSAGDVLGPPWMVDLSPLEAEALRVEAVVNDNTRIIRDVFVTADTGVMVIAGVLISVVAVSIPGMVTKRLRHLLLFCLSAGYIIVVLAWLSSGFTMIAVAFSHDMCKAMDGYLLSPGNSSIADLVPCVTPDAASLLLTGLRGAEAALIQEGNAALAPYPHGRLCGVYQAVGLEEFCGSAAPPWDVPYWRAVCGPSSLLPAGSVAYAAREAPCPGGSEGRAAGHFNLTMAEGGFQDAHCEAAAFAEAGACGDLIPTAPFEQAAEAARAAAEAQAAALKAEALLTCEVTAQAFVQITESHCSTLKLSSAVLWLGLLFVADSYSKLVLYWIATYGRYNHTVKGERTRKALQLARDNAVANGATMPPGLGKSDEVAFSIGGGYTPRDAEEGGRGSGGGGEGGGGPMLTVTHPPYPVRAHRGGDGAAGKGVAAAWPLAGVAQGVPVPATPAPPPPAPVRPPSPLKIYVPVPMGLQTPPQAPAGAGTAPSAAGGGTRGTQFPSPPPLRGAGIVMPTAVHGGAPAPPGRRVQPYPGPEEPGGGPAARRSSSPEQLPKAGAGTYSRHGV